MNASDDRARSVPVDGRYLNSILSKVSDVVIVLDRQGIVTYISPSVERILGYRPEEAVSTSVLSYIHPEDLPAAFSRLEAGAGRSGPQENVTIRVRAKDGRWATLEGTVNNLLQDPETRGHVIVARDISPRKRMETALQESEEKWRSLAENAPAIVMVTDRDGTIQFMNRTVSGFDMDRVIGTSMYDYIDPAYHQTAREVMERVFETGKPEMYRLTGAGPDGTASWYEAYVGCIRRGERVAAATSICLDVSARVRAEAALRESEEKWRSLAESAPAIITIVDSDGRILFLNKTLSGAPVSEIIGRNILDFIKPEERPAATNSISGTFLTGEGSVFETLYVMPDGRTVWLEGHASLVKWEGDTPAIVIAAIDITRRRTVETALTESEGRIESIFKSMADLIFVFDEEGRFSFCRFPDPSELYAAPEAFLGKTFREVMPEHMHGPFEEALARNRAGEVADYEYALELRGETRWYSARISPIFLDGRFGGSVVVARDMTERKRMEEELKKSRQELRDLYARLNAVREVERTKVAREIHDGLGQSLAVLSMQLEILRKKPPGRAEAAAEKFLSMSSLVERSVAEMRRICAELRPGLLDHLGLGPAMEWQAEEFQGRTGIRCHLETDLEGIGLDRDLATALFRILQESMTNIARHSGAKDVWINCGTRDGAIELVVSDDGRGVTEEQVSDARSLGLAGMRERAREWGGEVDVAGVPGEGTTVAVRIPVRRRSEENDQSIDGG